MESQGHSQDAEILQEVIAALSKVDQDTRQRILQTVTTFYGIKLPQASWPTYGERPSTSSAPSTLPSSFSEDRTMSPKDFLAEKQPSTDIEKVTCLAYYLTHYRSVPYFKTLDIGKLNTEAAQVKLSNPHYSVENAAKKGLLAASTQGQKQISAAGERYVLALPDRVAARAALAAVRRARQKSKQKASST